MTMKNCAHLKSKPWTRRAIVIFALFFLCTNFNAAVANSGEIQGRKVTCTGSKSQVVVAVVSSPRITDWGSWGSWEFCPPCTFARGFQIKVEGKQYLGDDTALNAIRLFCSDSHATRISSTQGPFGRWGWEKSCPKDKYFYRMDIRIEGKKGYGDDSSANDVNFKCGNGHLHSSSSYDNLLKGHGGPWGNWYTKRNCPRGSFICGIRTQVEPNRGKGDDTALNNVDLACCENRDGAQTKRKRKV